MSDTCSTLKNMKNVCKFLVEEQPFGGLRLHDKIILKSDHTAIRCWDMSGFVWTRTASGDETVDRSACSVRGGLIVSRRHQFPRRSVGVSIPLSRCDASRWRNLMNRWVGHGGGGGLGESKNAHT